MKTPIRTTYEPGALTGAATPAGPLPPRTRPQLAIPRVERPKRPKYDRRWIGGDGFM